MTNPLDDHVRAAFESFAGATTLRDRDSLLDTLTARIDDGGHDVADAPAPDDFIASLATGRHGRRVGKGTRIASIGLSGWVLVALGAAAAGAGSVWFALEASSAAGGAEPSPAPSIVAVAQPSDSSDDAARTGVPASPEPDEAHDEADGAAEAGGAPEGPADDSPETPSSGSSSMVDDALGAIDDVIDGVGTVVPEGPVADILAPVISAISVQHVTGSLVDQLLCNIGLSVQVSVASEVEVTSVAATFSTALGLSHTQQLTPSAGDTWSGTLAPSLVSDLGLLGSLLTVSIEAQDAHGNATTASSAGPSLLEACLG